jgi:unsaturated rhamnogalacturonyl hydrolase
MKVPHTHAGIVAACRNVAEVLLRHRWKLWFWGDSIGLEGLLAATALTGDAKYFGFVYGLLKGWVARQGHPDRFEHTAAGAALLSCWRETGDGALLEAARTFAAHLATYRKTESGCPVHYEDAHIELPPELPSDHPDYDPRREAERAALAAPQGGPCVFVDSVHFQGPFLAELFAVTKDSRYLEQAEATIGPQVALLWDEKDHLFHHFWSERGKRRNGVFWARGNGWGLLGVLHTLERLPPERPLASRFARLLREHAERLAALQGASGDWHTIVTDPTSYREASFAAFVVDGFSLGIRRGFLDRSYRAVVEHAWQAMWGHLREDGLFDGVSYETFPSFRAEHYRQMPRGAMVPWGQGPFLTACRSYLELEGTDR